MTIPKKLLANVGRFGEKPALFYKEPDFGEWQQVSWNEFGRKVDTLAAYLISISLKKGEKVVLLSENRPEWVISDLAILAAGAVTVPVYFTSTASQIDHILNDCGAEIVLVSTIDQLDKLLKTGSSENVRKIILMDAPRSSSAHIYKKVILLSDIYASSLAQSTSVYMTEIKERLSELSEEDLASILYTSGTTGPPKGVMLSHKNFLFNAAACAKVIELSEDDLLLSFLPLSHAFERTAGCYLPLLKGSAIAYAESIEKIPHNMLELRPTIMVGVPRFYEKTYASILSRLDGQSAYKKRLFSWGVKTGEAWTRIKAEGRRPAFLLSLKRFIADKLIFARVRAGMGGRLRFFVSGGAPLSREIGGFFDSIGVTILEGYGLTETSPVITCNTLSHRRAGTVGRALPGVEVRIENDGEIATKGPHVMKGYYNNEKATGEVIKEGWFFTGDIGEIRDGYLTITDRKKDLIVTAGGKNVAPQSIETVLIADPFINQIMVYGDGKKFISALIVPDMAKLEELARRKKVYYVSMEGLCSDAAIIAFYMDRIDAALKEFAPYEKVRKIALLWEPFSMDRGEITPTLKVNRKKITGRYRMELEKLYEDK
ncbi:MAG: long-chain fatty acid--CoA ligase [bacterium]|nr:long-chain fatty acid--CoA ligase [bacterium]